MAAVSSPGLLPLAKPTRIGLPYHGTVKNDILTLPSSATLPWQSPTNSYARMVKHSKAAASSETEGDDRNWTNYQLLSGGLAQIGSLSLGINRWIYCDDDYSWVVMYSVTPGIGNFTIKVELMAPFGIVQEHPSDLTMAARTLAEETFTAYTYTGGTVAFTTGTVSTLSHTKTGDVAYLNVGTSGSQASETWPYTFFRSSSFQHNLVRVEISGNGSILPGTVGSGISATISNVLNASALTELLDGTRTSTFAYAVTPDGVLKTCRLTEGPTVQVYGDEYYNESYGGNVRDLYGIKTGSVDVYGTSLIGTTEYSGVAAGTSWLSGSLCINGVCIDLAGTEGVPIPLLYLSYGFYTPILGYISGTNLGNYLAPVAHSSVYRTTEEAAYYWAYNPATGETASDPDYEVCYV